MDEVIEAARQDIEQFRTAIVNLRGNIGATRVYHDELCTAVVLARQLFKEDRFKVATIAAVALLDGAPLPKSPENNCSIKHLHISATTEREHNGNR